MNRLQQLANGMTGSEAIRRAWATCPSRIAVKHPDGASVRTACKAGASGKDVADSIVIAAATIKRGDGLSLGRKIPSKSADVVGSQSCELERLDSQAHAGIVGDFATAFEASASAQNEAADKILARTRDFEKALRDAETATLANEIRIIQERTAALRRRAAASDAPEDDKSVIRGWIDSGELDQAQAALDELANV